MNDNPQDINTCICMQISCTECRTFDLECYDLNDEAINRLIAL